MSDKPKAKRKAAAKHPMQPIVRDKHRVLRFKRNAIVCYLLDFATPRGCGMNQLALMTFSAEDREQFAQLIGYSVGGFGELSYVRDSTWAKVASATEEVSQ